MSKPKDIIIIIIIIIIIKPKTYIIRILNSHPISHSHTDGNFSLPYSLTPIHTLPLLRRSLPAAIIAMDPYSASNSLSNWPGPLQYTNRKE